MSRKWISDLSKILNGILVARSMRWNAAISFLIVEGGYFRRPLCVSLGRTDQSTCTAHQHQSMTTGLKEISQMSNAVKISPASVVSQKSLICSKSICWNNTICCCFLLWTIHECKAWFLQALLLRRDGGVSTFVRTQMARTNTHELDARMNFMIYSTLSV